MKKIFFGCSMRGGYKNVSKQALAEIGDLIEEAGYKMVTWHQTMPGIIDEEDKITKQEIHDRDQDMIKKSDVGIFEISNPSLGTGAEISDMINIGKPVLCLYKKGIEKDVSAYILGKSKSKYINSCVKCESYADFSEVKDKIISFVENCIK